jgi:hypothetical protein
MRICSAYNPNGQGTKRFSHIRANLRSSAYNPNGQGTKLILGNHLILARIPEFFSEIFRMLMAAFSS